MVVVGTPSSQAAVLANGDHGIERNDVTGKWFPGALRCVGETVMANT